MSEEIIKVLDDLAQRFGVAINWADKNVMPYLQELFDKFIDWEMWTSVMYGGVGLIAIIIGIILGIIASRIHKEHDARMGDAAFDYIICMGIPIMIGVTIIFTQLYDIIECLTFPEKTLFDYVTNYMDND